MQKNIVDSIVDLDELTNRIGDHEYLYDLLNEYVDELNEKLGQVSMLLIEENLEEIMSIVQSLKGTTSYMNMHYLWQTVCLLENALKRKDLKMIDIYFAVLSKEHERLAEYIISKTEENNFLR